ncbi:MAG TPA: hypothetical protein VL947_08270, partial [Cytophagales bacterium]|nr:hypothetical protein [Cytophagales bacterium]
MTSFGEGGIQWVDFGSTNDYATQVIVKNDGGIIVSGYSESLNNSRYSVAFLKSNGVLDASEGSSGKMSFQVSTGGNDKAIAACLYNSEDKLLIAGYSQVSGRHVVSMAQVSVRSRVLNSEFDYDGKKVLYLAGKNDRATGVAVTEDGALYVSAVSQQYDQSYHPICIKLDHKGNLDINFGKKGIEHISKAVSGHDFSQGITIQDYTKPILGNSSPSLTKGILVRLKDTRANMAQFTVETYGKGCEGEVKFVPKYKEGQHEWIFEDSYAPETSQEESPVLKFWKAGFYKVRHVVYDSTGYHSATQKIFVDKSPGVYTNQYAVMPYHGTTTLLGHSEDYFYPSEGNTFHYTWTHLGETQTGVRSISNSYPEPGFYPLTFQVVRTATYEDLCPISTLHDTILVTETYFNCTDDYKHNVPPHQQNLVVNGTFEESDVCPSQYFQSDFIQQCDMSGGLSPEQIAIVDFGGKRALQHTERAYVYDPFLLITRYDHILNRDVWSQEVQVQEGVEYLFFTEVLNYSFEVEGDYTFPTLSLVVDGYPI